MKNNNNKLNKEQLADIEHLLDHPYANDYLKKYLLEEFNATCLEDIKSDDYEDVMGEIREYYSEIQSKYQEW